MAWSGKPNPTTDLAPLLDIVVARYGILESKVDALMATVLRVEQRLDALQDHIIKILMRNQLSRAPVVMPGIYTPEPDGLSVTDPVVDDQGKGVFEPWRG